MTCQIENQAKAHLRFKRSILIEVVEKFVDETLMIVEMFGSEISVNRCVGESSIVSKQKKER